MAILETEVPERALADLKVIRNQSNAVARVIKHFQRYRDEQRAPARELDLNRVAEAAATFWSKRGGSGGEQAAPPAVRLELAPDAPRIACFDEHAFLYGDVALVLCEEELEGGTLAASNFFVREDGVWRIAHHHAGQIIRRQAERRRPSRLN